MNTPPENHADFNFYLIMGNPQVTLIDEKNNLSKRFDLPPDMVPTEENWEELFGVLIEAARGTDGIPDSAIFGCITFPAGTQVVYPEGNA